MAKTITFEDALDAGVIRQGDYFVTTTPKDRQVILTAQETGFRDKQSFKIEAGEAKLWRLEEELKMWGEPTKEKLTLYGKDGFIQGIDAMQKVARELYDLPDVFAEVQACGLPEKDYYFSSDKEFAKILEQAGKKYQHPDDKQMRYWLASRCVNLYSTYVYFRIFDVGGVSVGSSDLYRSDGYGDYSNFPVRPETTPSPKLLLETEGCDGTKLKPWICLSR